MSLNEIFDACREKNFEKVQRLSLNCNQEDLNIIMYNSCSMGNMEIVKLMIEKGANEWNRGLVCACESGHLDIIVLMISKGANSWNEVLFLCSCDIELIHFLIILGTDIENYMYKDFLKNYTNCILSNLNKKKYTVYFLGKYFNDDIVYMICKYF